MIEKSTIQEVLGIFFEKPSKEFHLRELSRLLKLSMPTIIAATDALAKERLVIKRKGNVLTTVKADRDNPRFLRHKQLHNLERVYCSGIVEFISSSYNHPKLIVLFGSYSRGEDIETSDIDIAVVTDKKLGLGLAKYERSFGKAIAIHEIRLNNTSPEFKANLANGIVLEGSW